MDLNFETLLTFISFILISYPEILTQRIIPLRTYDHPNSIRTPWSFRATFRVSGTVFRISELNFKNFESNVQRPTVQLSQLQRIQLKIMINCEHSSRHCSPTVLYLRTTCSIELKKKLLR